MTKKNKSQEAKKKRRAKRKGRSAESAQKRQRGQRGQTLPNAVWVRVPGRVPPSFKEVKEVFGGSPTLSFIDEGPDGSDPHLWAYWRMNQDLGWSQQEELLRLTAIALRGDPEVARPDYGPHASLVREEFLGEPSETKGVNPVVTGIVVVGMKEGAPEGGRVPTVHAVMDTPDGDHLAFFTSPVCRVGAPMSQHEIKARAAEQAEASSVLMLVVGEGHPGLFSLVDLARGVPTYGASKVEEGSREFDLLKLAMGAPNGPSVGSREDALELLDAAIAFACVKWSGWKAWAVSEGYAPGVSLSPGGNPLHREGG